MANNGHLSKTMQLHLMHTILSMAPSENELTALFTEIGCTPLMFESGKTLYDRAINLRADEINAKDAMHASELRAADLLSAVRDAYAGFVGVAKLCFGRASLETIGIAKKVPRPRDACCTLARIALQKVNEHPEFADPLTEKGFGMNRRALVQSLLDAYFVSVDERTSAVNRLDASRKDYAEVSDLIGRWLRQFASRAYPALFNQSQTTSRLDFDIGLLAELQEYMPLPQHES